MKIESVPLTFRHEGKTYKVNCTMFKPMDKLMYRIHIPNSDMKKEIVIVFQEDKSSPESLKYYKLHDQFKDGIAAAAMKALQKLF